MKKIIASFCFLLFFVSYTTAQAFDPQPLQNEIAGLEQQIKEARTESEKYIGGLIKALLDSRIQILEHTKVMLKQRLAAGSYSVKINYTLDGKEYVPPADKDEILKNLESEALRVAQEIERVQKEADQSSGGLIRVTKLSIVAINQQQFAMLEMKRCALIYDIPLFAFEEVSTAPAKSPTVPAEESLPEIDRMFEVKLTRKRVFEANYSEYLGFNLLLTNHAKKDIKAVQGILIFADLYDTKIFQISIALEKNVPAGKTIKNNNYSVKLNKAKSEHQRLKTINTKNLKMRFKVQRIIFTDGSIIKR